MSLYGTKNYGLALQPCGKGPASRHYEKTVAHGFDLDADDHALLFNSANFQVMRDLAAHSSSPIALWGLTPGNHKPEHRSSNTAKWKELVPGTVVAFVRDGTIFSVGTVLAKFRDLKAAKSIWSLKGDQAFELMYVLGDVTSRSIELEDLSRALGENAHGTPQSMAFPDATPASAILDILGQDMQSIPTEEPNDKIDENSLSSGPTDRLAVVKQRREQYVLKKALLAETVVKTCAICGTELPTDFLRAAHIKKRALCADEEKWDIPNIGMLACRFGCDDLYELGYVTIKDGRILISDQLPDSLAHTPHIGLLREKAEVALDSPLRDANREQYLSWHRRATYRGNPTEFRA